MYPTDDMMKDSPCGERGKVKGTGRRLSQERGFLPCPEARLCSHQLVLSSSPDFLAGSGFGHSLTLKWLFGCLATCHLSRWPASVCVSQSVSVGLDKAGPALGLCQPSGLLACLLCVQTPLCFSLCVLLLPSGTPPSLRVCP